MKIFVKEQLSPHKYKTKEGYLICTDAILARTGKQMYKKRDFFPDAEDADSDYEVDRLEEDVFEEHAIASFENKPITVEHPDENVDSTNYKQYEVGFVRDVHKGEIDGQPVLLGNLVIRDEQTIREIENGEHTDLSCGYDCDIADEENPHQTNIRGNHVALCKEGRAGIARIQDSAKDEFTDVDAAILVSKEGMHKKPTHDVEPKEGESKQDFISRFMSATKEEYPDSKQRLAVAYSYWDKSKKDACKDSTTYDKLVDEPKAWAEMKKLMSGYKVMKEGKTLFGRHHLEFKSEKEFDENSWKGEARRIAGLVDKVEQMYGTPSTYNIALNSNGHFIYAVIDIDTKYVKDSVQNALKVAKIVKIAKLSQK